MPGLNARRVAIVTGAGRGLGRAYALELARQGATVVVNDLGSAADGSGQASGPADDVVATIRSAGGRATASYDDVSDPAAAARLISSTVDAFGRLDILINNAGIVRDRMLVNMTVEDWDAVITVHLRGTFAPVRCAAAHWRERSKAGASNDARIVNTTSAAGLYGNLGQANYGAAKAGIAAFTIIAAGELARYGVTVNAVAPGARTRLTEQATPDAYGTVEPDAFDASDPANVAPLVAWLASPQASHVTGRVFNVRGGQISVAEGWRAGPSCEKAGRWEADELGPVMEGLLRRAAPNADLYGRIPPGSD
jgi:NAD(P)-dependent dehydrogenase (short-subunit alcohol dehydrogenase family)